MFGGFGGFGGGQQPNQPGVGFPGMGMNANVHMTTTTTHSSSSGGSHGMSGGMSGGMGGGDDPSKKSQDMQERYKYREAKLPEYNALVDVLEIKGEDVSFESLLVTCFL
jgi:hypothetical protein